LAVEVAFLQRSYIPPLMTPVCGVSKHDVH